MPSRLPKPAPASRPKCPPVVFHSQLATSWKPDWSRVERLEADNQNNVRVRVRWYYRPEESLGGLRQFHEAKELFLSDHYDVQSAHTIEGRCTIHCFNNYTRLDNVGVEDYYCRFEYSTAT